MWLYMYTFMVYGYLCIILTSSPKDFNLRDSTYVAVYIERIKDMYTTTMSTTFCQMCFIYFLFYFLNYFLGGYTMVQIWLDIQSYISVGSYEISSLLCCYYNTFVCSVVVDGGGVVVCSFLFCFFPSSFQMHSEVNTN